MRGLVGAAVVRPDLALPVDEAVGLALLGASQSVFILDLLGCLIDD